MSLPLTPFSKSLMTSNLDFQTFLIKYFVTKRL